MRISEEEAQRWGCTKLGIMSPFEITTDTMRTRPLSAPPPVGDATTSGYNTDPPIEQLIAIYKWHEAAEQEHNRVRKEVALRLMENRFISLKKLAQELSISRPTLYAWQQEHLPDRPDSGNGHD